jgi:hypothetical protein
MDTVAVKKPEESLTKPEKSALSRNVVVGGIIVELIEGDGGQGSAKKGRMSEPRSASVCTRGDKARSVRFVNDRGLLDLLVDGDDVVDDLVGMGLLLDDGLNVFVDVMVGMFVDGGSEVGSRSLSVDPLRVGVLARA